VEVKAAFSKLKGNRGKPLFFFFCESGADGKPVLVMDSKKVPPKETKAILATAKKKGKCSGKLAMNDDGELLVTPTGSAPSALAKGLQLAARNANAMVFNGIVIQQGAEADEDESEGEGEGERETESESEVIPEAPPVPGSPGANAPTAETTRVQERLKAILPLAVAAQRAGTPAAEALKLGVSQVQVFLRKNEPAQAAALLDRLDKLVKQAPSNGAPPNGSPPSDSTNPGLAAWTQARTKVVAKLKDYAKKVGDAKIPDHAKVAIRLLSVGKQLTAAPTTSKQLSELERYLAQDEVVQLAEQFPGDNFPIRAPLLAALQEMRQYLPK